MERYESGNQQSCRSVVSRSSGAGSQYGQDRILESPYAIVLRVRYATSTSLLRNRLSSESDRRIYPKYVGDNERFGMERDCFARFRRIGSDGSRIIQI